MPEARRLFALLLLLACLGRVAIAQRADEITATRMLGPQWKQLLRSAGIVFAGTVLRVEASPFDSARSIPTVEVTFRVDQPITGVEAQQELTIREWAGAWANHRPMRVGEHLLLFLYPPSQLGLTSPVGGQAGQFQVNSWGRIAPARRGIFLPGPGIRPSVRTPASALDTGITVRQLAHMIRSAREE